MWLIGMMGSGKTTVGEQAASLVGVPFYDTDRMVEERSQMPIDALWLIEGEDRFREMERDAVASVPVSGCIAAAGGGAVLDRGNRERMLEGRPVVWLQCGPEELARRVSGNETRPLLTGEGPAEAKLASILRERDGIYARVATDVIDTDPLAVEDVVSAVVEIWQR